MDTSNPYEAPRPSARVTMDGHSLRGELWHDAVVVSISLIIWWLVGVGGGAVLTVLCTPERFLASLESFRLVYWIRWGAALIGGLSGFFFSGLVVGRYLSGPKPWYFVGGIAVICAVMALFVFPSMLARNDGMWVDAVGFTSMLGGQVVRIGIISAMISFGIWLGKKQRASVESKRREVTNLPPRTYDVNQIPH